MRREGFIRHLGRVVPGWMRALRARLLLERYAAHLGADEVPCPACEGTGLLRSGPIERCPICRGFCSVPVCLAEWFQDKMAWELRKEREPDTLPMARRAMTRRRAC